MLERADAVPAAVFDVQHTCSLGQGLDGLTGEPGDSDLVRGTVTDDESPEGLAAAIERAQALTADQRAAGAEHARAFTWERMARDVRAALVQPQRPESSR